MNVLVVDFIQTTCWAGNRAHGLIVDQAGRVSLLSGKDTPETIATPNSTAGNSIVGTTTEEL